MQQSRQQNSTPSVPMTTTTSAPREQAGMAAGARLAPRVRALLDGGLGEALWLFVTLRLGLSLFALMASFLFEIAGPCTWEGGPLLHATGLDFRLIGVWQRWDACWYVH